ncbi:hypothetical protein [Bacteroides sp. 214]|nr:hypothetical protein [Bacteroides sp. 214]
MKRNLLMDERLFAIGSRPIFHKHSDRLLMANGRSSISKEIKTD